jgi:hypothetical protein
MLLEILVLGSMVEQHDPHKRWYYIVGQNLHYYLKKIYNARVVKKITKDLEAKGTIKIHLL